MRLLRNLTTAEQIAVLLKTKDIIEFDAKTNPWTPLFMRAAIAESLSSLGWYGSREGGHRETEISRVVCRALGIQEDPEMLNMWQQESGDVFDFSPWLSAIDAAIASLS